MGRGYSGDTVGGRAHRGVLDGAAGEERQPRLGPDRGPCQCPRPYPRPRPRLRPRAHGGGGCGGRRVSTATACALSAHARGPSRLSLCACAPSAAARAVAVATGRPLRSPTALRTSREGSPAPQRGRKDVESATPVLLEIFPLGDPHSPPVSHSQRFISPSQPLRAPS